MKWLKKPTSISPLFFTFFFLFFKQSLCLHPDYEACVPHRCSENAPNVSYPFYIHGSQKPSCGYPGLELHCKNGSTILRISDNDFRVLNIDYDKGNLRLQNTAILPNQTVSCFLNIRNLTLDPSRFLIDNFTTTKLVFISNCLNNTNAILDRYRIRSCSQRNRELVMLANDTNLITAREICGGGSGIVMTPVELGGGEVVVDGENYATVMKRGFVLSWLAAECDTCRNSGGRCGFNTTAFQFSCFCPNRPHKVRCRPDAEENHGGVPVLILALGAGVTTILIMMILCFRRKLGRGTKAKHDVINEEIFLKNHEFLAPKRYSYSQVKKMTNSFEVKLGQGGFGSVYRGSLSNGNLVTVKVLSELKGKGEDFINEVASVGRTSHVNVVSLVGFCLEGRQRALIYEFMPNGSLEKFIYGRGSSSNSDLGWGKLQQIAVGIARGLEYLHSGCNTRILHFDIKPHNILLDKNLCPKISDFGLAKLFPDERSKISMSCMRGTPGYIAPELVSRNFGQVSHKSDVYSYGMMILEMVGGRKNIEVEVDHTSEIYFPHWIYKKVELHEEKLELYGIVSDEENEMAKKMIIVGLWCIQTNPLSRPTMTKVLEMLEGDLALLEIPPKPYLSSPTRPVDSSSTY